MNKGNGRAGRLWLLAGELPKTMGGRIERLRIAAGLTQTALAARASGFAKIDGGLTKSFVSLLEADRTHPSVRTLAGMAAALGCSMNYLFWGQETGPERQAPEVTAEIVVEDPPPAPKRRPRVKVRVVRREVGGQPVAEERRVEGAIARRFLPPSQENAETRRSVGGHELQEAGRDPAPAGASPRAPGGKPRGGDRVGDREGSPQGEGQGR